jgi:hypothetical protein
MADRPPPTNAAPGVYGVEDLSAAWKRRKGELGPKVELGLKTAGLYLQRASQLLVPVDLGVLKASAFTRAEGKGFSTLVIVGYTAFYAMFVHENVEMKLKGLPRGAFRFKDDVDMIENLEKTYSNRGNYWDPAGRGQAKFLEAPARDETRRKNMLNIVKNICALSSRPGGGS